MSASKVAEVAEITAFPQARRAASRLKREYDAALSPIGQLPFVCNSGGQGGGRMFWSVASTGSYDQDCRIGMLFGREAVAYMRQYEAERPWLLCMVAVARVREGRADGDADKGFISGLMSAVARFMVGRRA